MKMEGKQVHCDFGLNYSFPRSSITLKDKAFQALRGGRTQL